MISRRTFLSVAAAGFGRALVAAPSAPTLLYVGAFQDKILVFDEAQEKVIDQIQNRTGIPRNLTLSQDRKKIFVFTLKHCGIEVVDVATRKVTSHFELDQGNRRVWLRNIAPDPEGKLLFSVITTRIKQIDRFEIEPPKFAVIDVAQQKIIKTVDYPKEGAAVHRLGASTRVSPDGKYLYIFRENVLIFDTTDFKLVETIELSKPPWPGMETVNLGPGDDPNDEPGIVTAIFNSTDPIVHHRIFGIARVDLTRRTFDFTPVGPATTGMYGLRLTPDRKTGYTVAFHDNLGNRRSEFWVFDMATRKLANKVEFPGPNNFRFTLSASGKQIYIHGSAPVMDLYDAATLQLKKSIDVGADLTTGLVAVPA